MEAAQNWYSDKDLRGKKWEPNSVKNKVIYLGVLATKPLEDFCDFSLPWATFLVTSFILLSCNKDFFYWNCCPGPSNKLVPWIEPYLDSCQYPLINYFGSEQVRTTQRLSQSFLLLPLHSGPHTRQFDGRTQRRPLPTATSASQGHVSCAAAAATAAAQWAVAFSLPRPCRPPQHNVSDLTIYIPVFYICSPDTDSSKVEATKI